MSGLATQHTHNLTNMHTDEKGFALLSGDRTEEALSNL